jgi:SAM-dependent methyltransferase
LAASHSFSDSFEARRASAHTAHNSRAWNALARHADPLAQAATDADFHDPLTAVDPAGWLGGAIRGWRVLCLAAGGGRHGALYSACGAQVTVVDASSEMLALDRAVATERRLDVRLVQSSMDDLSMFAAAEFDLVVHPVSTCYVPSVQPVFCEIARVTRPGGLYISQHKSPVSLQASQRPAVAGFSSASGVAYCLQEPYYRTGPLPPAEERSALREHGTLEFLHRLEEIVGGICQAGFVVENLAEPFHADLSASFGSFAHRAAYVAPYLRIKARRLAEAGKAPLMRP